MGKAVTGADVGPSPLLLRARTQTVYSTLLVSPPIRYERVSDPTVTAASPYTVAVYDHIAGDRRTSIVVGWRPGNGELAVSRRGLHIGRRHLVHSCRCYGGGAYGCRCWSVTMAVAGVDPDCVLGGCW